MRKSLRVCNIEEGGREGVVRMGGDGRIFI